MEIKFILFNPLGSARLIIGKPSLHSSSASPREACRTAQGAAGGALQVSRSVAKPLLFPGFPG